MIRDREILAYIEKVRKNPNIAFLKEICMNTKYDLEISFKISKEERNTLMIWLCVAITENGRIVLYYPQNMDYDESTSLLVSTNIATYNLQVQKMNFLSENDLEFFEELQLITKRVRELTGK